jgi:hypothetical protein
MWTGEKVEPEHMEIAWIHSQRKIDNSLYKGENDEEDEEH